MTKIETPEYFGPFTFCGWIKRLALEHNNHEDRFDELDKKIAKMVENIDRLAHKLEVRLDKPKRGPGRPRKHPKPEESESPSP